MNDPVPREDLGREETIFNAAVQLRDASKRAIYLDLACENDLGLRARIEKLLASDADDTFFGQPLAKPSLTSAAHPQAPGPQRTSPQAEGERIGRYRLMQKIGEGGCGVVYMAEQEEPVRRKVALKVIKLGMDTAGVIARFEAERQALALMDHANIAKILDAGATETGRPYFVMELVGGIKITDYCEQNHLNTRLRLNLFMQVCRAVQHAHQKGIIHRDIKPSNVLVATQDGVPVPKVIDFGIAKATQGRLTDQTVFTAFEQFLGTPAYMSPEQAQLGGLDVDTRSDIYSLGVLLYELLTGKTPFDAKELLAAGLEAMRKTIQEKEPPTPSTRLSQFRLAARSTGSSNAEIQNPKSKIDKDLDWVVMKCLEKDRARRYETANGLALDLERHLKNEPVLARPPSKFYEFQRTVRRHKVGFAAAAVFIILLATGASVSIWQAVRATRAGDRALVEKLRADKEAGKQQAINSFLNEMLASADPYQPSPTDQAKGPKITMLEVLNAAAKKVEAGSLKDRPEIEAAICMTLGETYANLFQRTAAQPLIRRALQLNRQLYGELSDPTIENLRLLANISPADRLQLIRDVLVSERKLHGEEHPHVAKSLVELATVRSWDARGRYESPELIDGIESTYRQGLAMQRKLLPPDSLELMSARIDFAEFLRDFPSSTNAVKEAEELLREALRVQTALGRKRHPNTARILSSQAEFRSQSHDLAGAEALSKQCLEIQQELFGTNHFVVSGTLDSLGRILQRQNKMSEAEAAFREALRIRRQAVPEGLDLAWSLRVLAENLAAQTNYPAAEEVYREALQLWGSARAEVGGVGSGAYWFHLNALTGVLKAQNKLRELETLYRDVLERQRQALGETNVAVPASLCRLADVVYSRGATNEAAGLYQEAANLIPTLAGGSHAAAQSFGAALNSRNRTADLCKLYETLIGIESSKPQNPNSLADWHREFADMLALQSQFESAATQYMEALPLNRLRESWRLAATLRTLGNALIECSRMKEAEIHLRESVAVCRATETAPTLWGIAWPTMRLGEALYHQGKLTEATQTYQEALVAYRNSKAVGGPFFPETVSTLVELLTSAGKLPETLSILEEILTEERRSFGDKSVKSVGTLVRLAQCHMLLRHPDDAARRRSEVADITAAASAEDLLHIPTAMSVEMRRVGLEDLFEEVSKRVLMLPPTTPGKAEWLDAASWFMILSPEANEQDPALALRLAQNANESSNQRIPGAALGAALYRTDNWNGAVAELEQAVKQDQGNRYVRDLLFLAMAHQRLGNADVARSSYKQAVGWMSEHSPCHKQVIRVRAEADKVLGH